MLFYKTTALLAAGLAAASVLDTRATCGETAKKVCYGIDGGESQNLDPEDVQYVADYLRYLGEENEGDGKYWNMPKAIGCDEWTLPVPNAGTVLALAKHISPRVKSSISYEDMAAAIDGGKDSSDGGKNELLGCGKNGGMMGVKTDPKNPLYNTDAYKKSGAKPEGVLIKLVRAPDA